ncbi:MAG: GNAT family N-acetyltransferase [Halothiobacillaceae bacterium]|nr:GNAT family N-acetyltransferase [Halothiobacillaceae bacterium]HER35179.1 GNAT family N-acetyltransferase [Halothiobacillaceae bacterium]
MCAKGPEKRETSGFARLLTVASSPEATRAGVPTEPVARLPARAPAPSGLALEPIGEAGLRWVAALADRIWWQVYPPIIGAAQVHYMLGRGYSLPALRASWRAGTHYSLLWMGPCRVGFSAWRPTPGSAFLDKLYLLPSLHGRGFGRWLIEATCREIAAGGHDAVTLRVNRHNHAALRAYARAGFAIIGRDRLPIGAGFVMDDYLMRRSGLNARLVDSPPINR